MSAQGPKTLLQMINQVQGVSGYPQASTIVGNSDATTLQMYNLMIDLTTELRRMKLWRAMMWEYVIEVQPAITLNGTFTANSGVVTGITQVNGTAPGTTGISPLIFSVNAGNVPTAARILSVDSATQFTMNMVSTVSGSQSFAVAQDFYQFPPDIDYMQSRTHWDRTNRWELLGPDSPQMDQWHQSGIVVTGPRRHFRKTGAFNSTSFMKIWPQPFEISAPIQFSFEYMSTLCVAGSGSFSLPGVGGGSYLNPANLQSTWLADTDMPMLDDDLLIKGLRWKFAEAKGFNFTSMRNDWLDYVDEIFARDGARGTLSLTKRVHPIFISPSNVQDGFFPGPVGPNTV